MLASLIEVRSDSETLRDVRFMLYTEHLGYYNINTQHALALV